MKNKYIDLIEQTFDFPQDEFTVGEDGNLRFNDIDLMEIIEQYGTPLKLTYLPKISSQIQRAKRLFKVAMAKADYRGAYHYSSRTNGIVITVGKTKSDFLAQTAHTENQTRRNIHIISPVWDEHRLASIEQTTIPLQDHLRTSVVIYEANYFHLHHKERTKVLLFFELCKYFRKK